MSYGTKIHFYYLPLGHISFSCNLTTTENNHLQPYTIGKSRLQSTCNKNKSYQKKSRKTIMQSMNQM
jgi:hypothetical protein